MEKLFVPYIKNKPACVVVNGHRLVVLTQDEAALTKVKSFETDDIQTLECHPNELEFVLANIQEEAKSGIVVTPHDIDPDDLIRTLEDELPWVQ